MLRTEMRNPKTTHIDQMSTLEMLQVINEENKNAVLAVEQELEAIGKAVDALADALKNGGRMFAMGAGTSGRLAVADAAECPPTYGVSKDMFVGLIAGGDSCLRSAQEKVEDIGTCGEEDLKNHNLTGKDVVIGISAAGGASYVLQALSYAKSLGCTTIGITSNKGSKLDLLADISISPDTGPEVITGSTRMKAGTSQKLILNMLSTCAMVKNGYVYENLMINLKPSNDKLRQRIINIVTDVTKVSESTAIEALDARQWDIRATIDALK